MMSLLEYLKINEGLRLTAYKDTVGVWTVGYGDTGPHVVEGTTITKEEAERRLERRSGEALAAAGDVVGRQVWLNLNHVRRVVLADMCYQMGKGGLAKFERTLAAVRESRWDDACIFMLQSKWAKQTPNRARRNAASMLTGLPFFGS